MQDVRIADLMTADVKCAAPDAPLSRIVHSMKTNRHSCVVIADGERPVGIITERDIVHHFSDLMQKGSSYDPPAAGLMSAPPVTVEADTSLIEALVVTRSNEIRHLPVVDGDGKLVGLVTQTDLVAAHFKMIETRTRALDRAVANRTQELVEANLKLKELMLEDPLLAIGNRRAMEIDLAHTHAAARRFKRCYSVILSDIDNFKLYNDHYGHAAGDRALQTIAGLLKSSARKSDRVYRYGGEELLILLPETKRDGAQVIGQRLIDCVAACRIPHLRNPLGVMTLSSGISCLDDIGEDESWRELVKRADQALYRAKSIGRNRAVSYYKNEQGSAAFSETVSIPPAVDGTDASSQTAAHAS